MDELTSLRNCNYGFQDGDRTVYSNLPEDCLRMWLDRLISINETDPFLEPEKDLVVVNLDQRHLDHLVSELFPDFLTEAQKRKIPLHRYPHHTADSFLDIWEPRGLEIYGKEGLLLELNDDKLKMIYGRVKFKDSVTEKLTRLNTKWEMMGLSEDFLIPYHITATDIIALTVVCEDETACYNIKKEVDKNSHLTRLEKGKDYIARPKKTGYRSLHQYYIWLENTLPTGTVFEIHFETLADHPLNLYGNGTDERSHRFHGDRKLLKEHELGNNQIIVLEKNGQDYNELIPTKLKNRLVEYTLINY